MTRNQKYERKKVQNEGVKKITIWVPEDIEADVKEMVRTCTEDRDLVPVACRSKSTGRLRYL